MERDCVRLVPDKLQWPLKKYFLSTRFVDLYQLSSNLTKYEQGKASRFSVKNSTYKITYYREVAEISPQQTNKTDLDSSNKEELGQIKMCVTEFVERQPFEFPTLNKPRPKNRLFPKATQT